MGINVDLITEDDTGKPAGRSRPWTSSPPATTSSAWWAPTPRPRRTPVAKKAEQYKVPLVNPVPRRRRSRGRATSTSSGSRLRPATTQASCSTWPPPSASRRPSPSSTRTPTSASRARRAPRSYAEKKGIKVVFEEAYSPGSPDYRSTLVKVKGANPDLMFMVSYVADAITLMRQSRELELTPMAFLGAGAGFSAAQFASEKNITQGVFSSTQWTHDVRWPGSKAWYTRYLKRFGKAPTYHAANAYESMMIMGETAAKAGGDREKTRATLRTGKWNGIFGEVKFEDFDGYQNQRKAQMLVEQVQDGKYETVWPLEGAARSPSGLSRAGSSSEEERTVKARSSLFARFLIRFESVL